MINLNAWGILTIKSSISMLRVFLPYEIIFIERNIFYVFCPRKFFDEFAERVKKYSKNKNKIEELSILILGVDSVSRSNMIRYMPETRKYLLQNMSAFELNGISMLRVFLPYEIIFIERNIFHVLCPRKFFDEFSGCHGNYVNKGIICYFIIAIKLKGRHIKCTICV
jgi:hypothetical protein